MKRWYKSKAIWGGIITAIPSVFAVISPYLDPTMQETLKSLYQAVLPLGMGLGIMGIRSMKQPIGKQEKLNQVNLKGYDSEILPER